MPGGTSGAPPDASCEFLDLMGSPQGIPWSNLWSLVRSDKVPRAPLEPSGAPRHNLMDSAVDFEIMQKPKLFIMFPRFGLPRDVSGGLGRSPWTQRRSLVRHEDVLGALLDVNQTSFKHLECLVGAPRAQGKAQGPKTDSGTPDTRMS